MSQRLSLFWVQAAAALEAEMAVEGGDGGRAVEGGRGRSLSPDREKRKREKWRRSRSREKCVEILYFPAALLGRAFACPFGFIRLQTAQTGPSCFVQASARVLLISYFSTEELAEVLLCSLRGALCLLEARRQLRHLCTSLL